MAENEKEEPVKIVLIGESGVGKTSIIYQFIDKVFQSEQQSTIGGTYAFRNVKCSNGKTLKLEIWDTAGQERYRSVTKMFYKDAGVAILVYDLTNKKSYEELKSYWVKQVKELSSKNIILVLVSNKSDLYEEEQVNEEEARNYAKEINAFFALTSAKDTSGINNLFLDIAKIYSGAESASTVEEKDQFEEYKRIRRESIKITKENQNKKKKLMKCC